MLASLTPSLLRAVAGHSPLPSPSAPTPSGSQPPPSPRQPPVVVSLADHYAARVYTTGSTVAGTVAVRVLRHVPFDAVRIVLVGTARTRCNLAQFPRQSSRVFLRVAMPLGPEQYPAPRVLVAGCEYRFPFSFVVPRHLTVGTCEHPTCGDHIREEHERLPPSMGPGSWAGGARHGDDMAPDVARIEYAVTATVLARPSHGRAEPARIIAGSHPINVLPVSAEAPPLSLSPSDRLYAASRSKVIRRGFLAGRTGSLAASAAQPRAVFISPDGRTAAPSAAAVRLAFAPATPGALPPKIGSITARITAATFFGPDPAARLPNLDTGRGSPDLAVIAEERICYSTSLTLFSAVPGRLTWRTTRRRDGHPDVGDDADATAAAAAAAAATEHVAVLSVPFSLPTDRRLFLPTFHSCLISRVYVLHLIISAGPTGTTMTLSLPLQVVVGHIAERNSDETGEVERW